MENQFIEILKAIKDVSPLIWEAALRQNNIFGILNIVFGLLMLGIVAFSVHTLIKIYRDSESYEKAREIFLDLSFKERDKQNHPEQTKYGAMKGELNEVSLWALATMFTLWGIPLIIYGIMYLTNPIYWTIHSLLFTLHN